MDSDFFALDSQRRRAAVKFNGFDVTSLKVGRFRTIQAASPLDSSESIVVEIADVFRDSLSFSTSRNSRRASLFYVNEQAERSK